MEKNSIPFEELAFSKEKGEIGRGAFGTVYEGSWRGKKVAIKKMHTSHTSGEYEEFGTSYNEKMKTEILGEISKLLAMDSHPNILPCYGFSVKNGIVYFVTKLYADGDLLNFLHARRVKKISHMEPMVGAPDELPSENEDVQCEQFKQFNDMQEEVLLEGHNSQGLNKRFKKLSMREKVGLCLDLARGLQYLKKKQFVHRDIRPKNILVDTNSSENRPVAVICDFGLCRNTSDITQISIGEAEFCAPEVRSGDKASPLHESDVFSLGMTMNRILLDDMDPMVEMKSGLRTPDLPQQHNDLCDLILECCADKVEERMKIDKVVGILENAMKSICEDGTRDTSTKSRQPPSEFPMSMSPTSPTSRRTNVRAFEIDWSPRTLEYTESVKGFVKASLARFFGVKTQKTLTVHKPTMKRKSFVFRVDVFDLNVELLESRYKWRIDALECFSTEIVDDYGHGKYVIEVTPFPKKKKGKGDRGVAKVKVHHSPKPTDRRNQNQQTDRRNSRGRKRHGHHHYGSKDQKRHGRGKENRQRDVYKVVLFNTGEFTRKLKRCLLEFLEDELDDFTPDDVEIEVQKRRTILSFDRIRKEEIEKKLLRNKEHAYDDHTVFRFEEFQLVKTLKVVRWKEYPDEFIEALEPFSEIDGLDYCFQQKARQPFLRVKGTNEKVVNDAFRKLKRIAEKFRVIEKRPFSQMNRHRPNEHKESVFYPSSMRLNDLLNRYENGDVGVRVHQKCSERLVLVGPDRSVVKREAERLQCEINQILGGIPITTNDTFVVMLLGMSGVGKSTLGNFLLHKQNYFKEGSRLKSETTACSVGSYNHKGRQIIIIDTPGLRDTEGRDHEHIGAILRQLKSIGFIHLLVYTNNIRHPRSGKVEEMVLQYFHECFGKGFFKENVAICYTHSDESFRESIMYNRKMEERDAKRRNRERFSQIKRSLSTSESKQLVWEDCISQMLMEKVQEYRKRDMPIPEYHKNLCFCFAPHFSQWGKEHNMVEKRKFLDFVVEQERKSVIGMRILKTPLMFDTDREEAEKLIKEVKELQKKIEAENTKLFEVYRRNRKKKKSISDEIREKKETLRKCEAFIKDRCNDNYTSIIESGRSTVVKEWSFLYWVYGAINVSLRKPLPARSSIGERGVDSKVCIVFVSKKKSTSYEIKGVVEGSRKIQVKLTSGWCRGLDAKLVVKMKNSFVYAKEIRQMMDYQERTSKALRALEKRLKKLDDVTHGRNEILEKNEELIEKKELIIRKLTSEKCDIEDFFSHRYKEL